MTAETWGALIAAVLGSGLLTAVTNNVWQRRRARADTAAVLNETALELVVPLKEEIKELRGEVRVVRQQNGIMARQLREYQAAHALHQAWDISAQAALMTHGVELPPMPPLAPTFQIRGERTRAEDYELPDTVEGAESD